MDGLTALGLIVGYVFASASVALLWTWGFSRIERGWLLSLVLAPLPPAIVTLLLFRQPYWVGTFAGWALGLGLIMVAVVPKHATKSGDFDRRYKDNPDVSGITGGQRVVAFTGIVGVAAVVALAWVAGWGATASLEDSDRDTAYEQETKRLAEERERQQSDKAATETRIARLLDELKSARSDADRVRIQALIDDARAGRWKPGMADDTAQFSPTTAGATTSTTSETPSSPFPPDPGCPEGRGVLGSQYGPVRFREKVAPCGLGDVCGFFYLAASSLTCQDGGDTAAEQAKKMLADSGVSGGTVIVFIDVNGRRAAGIVFPTAEVKQEFLTALGKPEDKLFTSYAVWRAYPRQG